MNEFTDRNDLRIFAVVVEHGSFTAAVRALGTQTSTLNRRVRTLAEKEIDVLEERLDEAADITCNHAYWNARPLERDAIRALLQRAFDDQKRANRVNLC